MAGLGRRTHYRKHLTDAVLHDFPEPNEADNEQIAKVVATRGSNQFEIVLGSARAVPQLAILPTKYRKLVWLKRNDYVIVQGATSSEQDTTESQENATAEDTCGIRYIINHILYKEQIKHLKSKEMWPSEFENKELGSKDEIQEDAIADKDGIVYEVYDSDEDNDDDLFVNTNRVNVLNLDDEEEEDSSEEEEDESDGPEELVQVLDDLAND